MLTEQLDTTEESAGFRKGRILQDVNAANYEGDFSRFFCAVLILYDTG